MQIQDRIENTFGNDIFTVPTRLDDSARLRFVLSQGSSTVERLLLSLQQVNSIFDEIFCQDDSVVVCLRTRSESSLFSHRSLLTELYTAGINVSDAYNLWVEVLPEEDKLDKASDECWFNLAFEVPASMLPKLLWCTHASDFGSIRLRPSCTIFLFNFSDRLLVVPHEDLTVDIVGADAELSAKLLAKFTQHTHQNNASSESFLLDSGLLDTLE